MQQKNKQACVVTALVALLSACGGGGGGNSGSNASGYPQAPASCEVSGQRAWLRDYMNDQYFWYDKQGAPNEAATSMAEYLNSLLFKPVDRYSGALSTAQFTQVIVEGRRTGYGYTQIWTDDVKTTLKVVTVEPRSPVGLAGLQRGDSIISVNGLTPLQIANGALQSVSTAGVARDFVVKKLNGTQISFTVNSADYPLTPVLESKVLTAPNGAKVGYVLYQEFVTSSNAALGGVIDNFRSAGVGEVVLDLRYNPGGDVNVARNLASMLGGSSLNGKVFANFKFNNKKSANNFAQTFTSSTATLPTAPLDNLSRIVIITAGGTASASELVLNSLKPFKEVVTIGSTSYGKPYAFQPREACGITYATVNAELSNANGIAVPTTGVPATCAVSDDLTHLLGDPAELRTAAALNYISTGVCPAVSAVTQGNSANTSVDSAQAATKNIASEQLLGEDARLLPAPRALLWD